MGNKESFNIDNWLKRNITISFGMLLLILIILPVLFFIVKNSFNVVENKSEGLEIDSLVRKVKTELMQAETAMIVNNEQALFRLKDFEMELSFTVRKNENANAEFAYKFVTVEGGSELSNEKVQKLILRWDAIQAVADTIPADSSEIIIEDNNP